MTNTRKETSKKWQWILLIILATALVNYGLGFLSGNIVATLKIVVSLTCVIGIAIIATKSSNKNH